MLKKNLVLLVIFFAFILGTRTIYAQRATFSPNPSPTNEAESTESASLATPTPRPDITQKTEETLGPLEKLLQEQELGPIWPTNPLKYAIRGAVTAGVPVNTIVLLLLLPLVATVIAASRHMVGLRGFGIFLPAALSVVFVATGPVVGIGLFLVIVISSVVVRLTLRRAKIKLQYLPRMALILLFVVLGVLGVLFLAPIIRQPNLANASIFPILLLVLLAEDFTKVQLGKSAKTAIQITGETLILALVSFLFLTSSYLQKTALHNPEAFLVSIAFIDFLMGKYIGLRFLEFWRFRKLISS